MKFLDLTLLQGIMFHHCYPFGHWDLTVWLSGPHRPVKPQWYASNNKYNVKKGVKQTQGSRSEVEWRTMTTDAYRGPRHFWRISVLWIFQNSVAGKLGHFPQIHNSSLVALRCETIHTGNRIIEIHCEEWPQTCTTESRGNHKHLRIC